LIGVIPWEVDVPQERVPFANYVLIGSIIVVSVFYLILVFMLTSGRYVHNPSKINNLESTLEFLNTLVLDGYSLPGLIGHIWLHGGLVHLLGNMLFLWIFGNAVCAKVGNGFYVLIFLLVGIFSAMTHHVFQGGWAIGASGAVNGIVGLYLVLFPQNDITCYFFMWFFLRPYWKEFTLSSFWMILFWLMFDIFGIVQGAGNVAYFAHIGGFAAGFGLGMVMLMVKAITMDRYERSLLEVIRREKVPGEQTYEPKIRSTAFPRQVYIPEVREEEPSQNEKIELSTILGMEGEKTSSPALSVDDVIGDGMIRFTCVCGKPVKVKKKYAGRTGKCPRCKRRLEIPDSSTR